MNPIRLWRKPELFFKSVSKVIPTRCNHIYLLKIMKLNNKIIINFFNQFPYTFLLDALLLDSP